MSVAWHIVRKDLVRLRWVLALWIVVLVASLGLASIQTNLSSDASFPFWIAAVVLTMGVLPLIAFGLVMGLLHDDPVAELDAFWITRPISSGQLLDAKLLALLLFAALPVVVTFPFWLNYDYRWPQIGWAAVLTLRNHFILVALALPLAAISANGSKFVMNVMVGAGGSLLLVLLLQLGESREAGVYVPGLVRSKAWMLAGVWLTAGIVVTLNQFFRRRTRQSMLLLVAAVALGLSAMKWWPWVFVSAAAASPPVMAAASGFSAMINGAIRPAVVLAEVPLRDNASASRAGQMLKIQTVFLDYTGELQVAFSTGVPELARGIGDFLPDDRRTKAAPEYYFITNASDGRMLPVTPVPQGNGLAAATLLFLHFNFRLRPAAAVWQGGAPSNLTAWLQGARLVKVVAVDASRP